METLLINSDVCTSDDLSFLLASLDEIVGLSELIFWLKSGGEDSIQQLIHDVNYCRALLTEFRADLELKLMASSLTEVGSQVLLDGIQRNRGPNTFLSCNSLLTDALRGNRSVHAISLDRRNFSNEEDLIALMWALAENLGLAKLNLGFLSINDESWTIMRQSLANHPTLEHLGVLCTSCFERGDPHRHMPLYDATRTLRTQALVDMLKVNSSIHSICLISDERCESIWSAEIKLKLRLNSYTAKIVAVAKASITFRAALFGRALSSAVSDDNSLLYLFLTGNKDLVCGPPRR
jgi:hypothetical protein